MTEKRDLGGDIYLIKLPKGGGRLFFTNDVKVSIVLNDIETQALWRLGKPEFDILSAFDGVDFLFWTCPHGCQDRVTWRKEIATCEECGQTSEEDLNSARAAELEALPAFEGPDEIPF